MRADHVERAAVGGQLVIENRHLQNIGERILVQTREQTELIIVRDIETG